MVVKITGLMTKIPLLHLLHAQGMGYYNTAYEVYALLFVLSTAGLPVALSILISETRGGAAAQRRVLRCAVRLFLAVGVIGGGVLWLGADTIAAWMGNRGAAGCMRALAPAVLCVCLAAAVRGYYQGMRDMRPTAVSQVLEAVGKLGFGLWFAAAAQRAGHAPAAVAAAAAAGLSAATALSLVYLLCRIASDAARARREPRTGDGAGLRPAQHIAGRLLRIAVPITAGAAVMTLTRLLDMVLILRRLRVCGYTEAAVNALYGAYSTLAIPLYSLLPTLIGAIALPLVPGIAHAREAGDITGEREVVRTAFRLTVLLALPASLGLAAFSGPILALLFRGEREVVAVAAPLLSLLGMSVLGSCLVSVTNAMLQAYHRSRVPLGSMTAGACLKLCCAWVLLGMPQVGMAGAPISSLLCHLCAVCINVRVLGGCLPRGCGMTGFCLRALGASAVSVGGALACHTLLLRRGTAPSAATLIALCLCVAAYFLLMLCLGMRRTRRAGASSGTWVLCALLGGAGSGVSGGNAPKNAQNSDKFPQTT